MSIQHSQEVEALNLPLRWVPGTDLMSKLLLCEPKVIDLVVQSLVGADTPANSYTVDPTEWADSRGIYTLYVSQNSDNDRHVPVLVALQEEVNQIAMLETIDRCVMVYEKFRVLPTVLIISIKGSSSLEDDQSFSAIDDSFLVQCECSFWAHKCFLFFPDSVDMDAPSTATSLLAMLCQFISSPNKTLSFSRNLKAQTICLACEATTSKEN